MVKPNLAEKTKPRPQWEGDIILRIMKKLFLLLILLALLLRFYRLPDFTEFYGDQGLDGMLVLHAVYDKAIPLVGPPSSQGMNQGAFYLYLIAPILLLTNFNPLGPAFFMAALGTMHVAVFYFLTKKLFSEKVALFTTTIFALSPIGIFMSRTYWNSFLLPIGTTVLLFCLVVLKEKKKLNWFLITGFLLGVFVQMHYTGLMLIPMTVFFWVFLRLWQYKRYTIFSFIAFSIPFIPFFIFQFQNHFVDLRGLAKLMYPLSHIYRNVAPPNIPTLFAFAFQTFVPKMQIAISAILGLLLITIPFYLKKATFWHKMLTAWLSIALIIITRNRGDFQLHYLDILFPLPFLLFASVLNTFESKKEHKVVFALFIIFLFLNVIHLDLFSKSEERLAKTENLVQSMINQSNNKPFSFTIISPSFSDTHYRFLFAREKVVPVKITENAYDTLFIACEKTDCPTAESLQMTTAFPVTCYDLHCEIFYPKIDLTMWKLVKEEIIHGGKLFTFKRLLQKNEIPTGHKQT